MSWPEKTLPFSSDFHVFATLQTFLRIFAGAILNKTEKKKKKTTCTSCKAVQLLAYTCLSSLNQICKTALVQEHRPYITTQPIRKHVKIPHTHIRYSLCEDTNKYVVKTQSPIKHVPEI